MYFSPVSSRRSGCLSQRVSGGVIVLVSENANVGVKALVRVSVSVGLRVSESVIVRVMLSETPLPNRARANASGKNQRGKSMLEAGHVQDARNELMNSSL